MAKKKEIKNGFDEFVSTEDEAETDPFAVDFFSQSNLAQEEDEEEFDESTIDADLFDETEFVAKRLWSTDLPQTSISEVNQKRSYLELPNNLAETVCQISTANMSQIILRNADAAKCETVLTFETDYAEETLNLNQEQAVCLSFVLEPHQEEALIILDAVFAVRIIETALNSENMVSERRMLSKTELVVLEFLALNCLKDINDFFSEPLFRWRNIEQAEISSVLKRGLLSKIRIQIGEAIGIAKILMPFDFLQNLSQISNPLLNRHQKRKNIEKFSKIVSGVKLHLILGETTIDASEMAVLERGDIILIERPLADFADSNLTGSIHIRVGDEISESLYGELSTAERLRFQLREVNQKIEIDSIKSTMAEYKTENQSLDATSNQTENLLPDEAENAESSEGVLALEKVMVKIAVELTSRRISLNELANINIGQIIELGSRATDPVELVADGRVVAIGDLIDVEGNLAVRLTRVLL